MGVHDGHRKRLIARFLAEGLDNFSPHNILELLLFFSVPRRDTNELAHSLLDRFGNLAGVLNATTEELTAVPGIGGHSAALITLIPHIARAYALSQNEDICIDSTQKAGEYMLSRYIGRTDETVFLTCLDGKCKVISTTLLHKGSVNATEINIRKLISAALQYNAAGLIIAHNHPGGVALPSHDDLVTTKKIVEALKPINISLIDHIIIADNDFVSLADTGGII